MCKKDSPQPQNTSGQVNEILDKIEREPSSIFGEHLPSGFESGSVFCRSIAENTKTRFLIENSDIALPLMFERIEKQPRPRTFPLMLYFIVFEDTKSAESIPYIADYMASCDENVDKFLETMVNPFAYAVNAAEAITSLEFRGNIRTIFNQRLDIANQLRQWYEEYKKNQDKNRE